MGGVLRLVGANTKCESKVVQSQALRSVRLSLAASVKANWLQSGGGGHKP